MKYILCTIAYLALVSLCCSSERESEVDRQAAMRSGVKEASSIKSYILNHEIRNVDYQIYVNDILIGQSHENNGVPAPYNLGQYIFSSGEQQVSIRISANSLVKDITSEILKQVSKHTGIYLLEDKDYSKITEIRKLEFPTPQKPTKSYEFEWRFDAKAVQGITSLENSQDLSLIDKRRLQQEVLSKYEELRKLLNTGKTSKFMEEISGAKNDLFLADRLSEEDRNKYDENLKRYLASHKALLPDLNGAQVHIIGRGRAVILEDNARNNGVGFLSTDHKEEVNTSYIILHKPIGESSFKVFRYQIFYSP